MKNIFISTARFLVPAVLSAIALGGCGGGTSDFSAPSFNIGGTVSGLNVSTSVQLLIVGSTNTVTVSQDGSYQFPSALPFNSSYSVTVAQQPNNQTCTVSNGDGSDVRAAVSNVNVSCVTNGYTVGGTLTGLAASTSVTLSNNNAESITLSGDGSFSFTTPVLTYEVTVVTQPTGQACLVSQGSGTASANVTNVSVVCATAVALDCPPGEVITGIDGRSGGIIDKLTLRCAPLVASVPDTASTVNSNSVGGGGGSAFSPNFTCPTGEWVNGINGRNGSFGGYNTLASVQVTCSGGSLSPFYNSGTNFSFSCPVGLKATGFLLGVAGPYSGTMSGITCQ